MIYFDLTCCYEAIGNFGSYSGGVNYSQMLLKALVERVVKEDRDLRIILPKQRNTEIVDEAFFDNNNVEAKVAESIEDVGYGDDDLLFVPMVYGSNLMKIHKVKANNPRLTVGATLHDRQHNYYKYDWYDRVYPISSLEKGLLGRAIFQAKKVGFDIVYEKCIGNIDFISTDSNYSMQRLMSGNINTINYYQPQNVLDNYKVTPKRGDYILLVSGNRPEKNLARTLEAFCRFKRQTKSTTRFVATGVSDELKRNLYRDKRIDIQGIEKSVKLLHYVPTEKLSELYANCRYVIFPSKGEGYGLPVVEAMTYGKTCLASRTTSVPEVAGACLTYIDPFSVISIIRGMKKMESDELLDRQERYLKKRYEIYKEISELDTEILIDEIMKMVER